MPAVKSGKVLVTGANGYIAAWTVNTLLEQGYSVRGTVRSEAKAVALRQTFSKYSDRLEVIVIDDIAKEGVFDEAVKGIDAIAHLASPCHLDGDDPQEYIGPAVAGTVGLLKSALEHGPSVKRIAITSSCGTVRETPEKEVRTYTSDDWAEGPVLEVKEKGRNASQLAKYRASKILAERAAWEFVESHKGQLGYEIVTLCGPHIFGPPIEAPNSIDGLSASMKLWLMRVMAANDTVEGHEWLDARDFALAHVLAISQEAAGNNRIIVAAGPWKWQDWVNSAHGLDKRFPEGDTTYDHATTTHICRYDHSKAENLLGLKCRSIEETTKDIVTMLQSKNLVPE
ncbi:hypothetical protein EIP86_005195 [Pleurotus ostreatoroseus]|nr:hypothetical protein EIP86_005195 [Pleurotus ostreatoroseus]